MMQQGDFLFFTFCSRNHIKNDILLCIIFNTKHIYNIKSAVSFWQRTPENKGKLILIEGLCDCDASLSGIVFMETRF